MRIHRIGCFACVALFLSLFSLAANGQQGLLLSTGPGHYAGYTLGLMDPTTGDFTVIGQFTTSSDSNPAIGGLGYSGGKLYAFGADNNLYIVDPTSAALTLVGSTGMNVLSGFGWGMGTTITGQIYAYGGSSENLYSLDPTTGAGTVIGPLGIQSSSALQSDAVGNMYLTGGAANQNWYKLNLATGAAELLGTGTYAQVDALGFLDGVMYAPSFNGNIYIVNIKKGTSTPIATFDVSSVGNPFAAVATPWLTKFSVKPASVVGSNSVTGTLDLIAPVPVDTVVPLTTTNAGMTGPASVTVPAGASTLSFPITTMAVSTITKGKINASLGKTLSVALTVEPIGVQSIELSSTKVPAGSEDPGMITLQAPAAPGDITVMLSSSNTNVATVSPSSVTVSAGSSTANFTVITNASVTQTTKVTITATPTNGGKAVSKALTVTP